MKTINLKGECNTASEVREYCHQLLNAIPRDSGGVMLEIECNGMHASVFLTGERVLRYLRWFTYRLPDRAYTFELNITERVVSAKFLSGDTSVTIYVKKGGTL